MLSKDFTVIQKICRCIVSSTTEAHIKACKNLIEYSRLDKTTLNHLNDLMLSQQSKISVMN